MLGVYGTNYAASQHILTQEMFSKTNTTYVISRDYVLLEDITIPSGCTLDFNGGSIKNKRIHFQGTYIKAGNIAIFEDVTFSGTLSNDSFNVLWIKAGDIGEKINKASASFNKVYVPYNEYSYTTPIIINSPQKLELNGVYVYDGKLYNGLSLIKIDRCHSTTVHIGKVTVSGRNRKRMDYRDDRTMNVIGVNLDNSIDSRLYVESVNNVNEGIRISCTQSTLGGGDNFIEANLLWNNNIGVRIYQQDSSEVSSLQFVNDTRIRVNYCSSRLKATKYGVYVAGPLTDKDSYRINKNTDRYDKCSGVVIDGGDYEDLDVGFYCRNAGISIENAREENIKTFVKAVGRLKLHYVPKYLNSINKLDLSECTGIILNGLPSYVSSYNRDIFPLVKHVDTKKYVCNYNYHILDSKGVIAGPVLSHKVEGVGYIVSGFSTPIIRIESEEKTRFIVAYLDSNNNNISSDIMKPSSDFYKAQSNVFCSNVDIRANTIIVPDNVNRIFIGVPFSKGENSIKISCFSDMDLDDNPVSMTGVNRPQALPPGISFFDTRINKPIWWSGDEKIGDAGWVDANGNHPGSK